MAILYNDEGKPITKGNPLPVSFEDANINLPPGSVVFPDEMQAGLVDDTGTPVGKSNPLTVQLNDSNAVQLHGTATQVMRELEISSDLHSIENTGASTLLLSFDSVNWVSIPPSGIRSFSGRLVESVFLRCTEITTSYVVTHGGTQ